MTLETLREGCSSCTGCELCKTRHNVVFGRGAENARLMFIGEAPGKNEDLEGLPFVGAAGKLLDTLLDAVAIDKDSIYIANIVKCRPPSNRDPLPSEEDACIGYLRQQIELIKPSIIVCLGRISAKRIISPDFQITRQRGQWFTETGIKKIAVFHPAALIYDNSKKPETYLDFKEIAREFNQK